MIYHTLLTLHYLVNCTTTSHIQSSNLCGRFIPALRRTGQCEAPVSKTSDLNLFSAERRITLHFSHFINNSSVRVNVICSGIICLSIPGLADYPSIRLSKEPLSKPPSLDRPNFFISSVLQLLLVSFGLPFGYSLFTSNRSSCQV